MERVDVTCGKEGGGGGADGMKPSCHSVKASLARTQQPYLGMEESAKENQKRNPRCFIMIKSCLGRASCKQPIWRINNHPLSRICRTGSILSKSEFIIIII